MNSSGKKKQLIRNKFILEYDLFFTVTCGGDYFVTDGNFTMVTSPGFPIGYANNLNCRWTLTTDPHYKVAMTLITLDMEAGSCMFDRVEISNGGLYLFVQFEMRFHSI